MRWDLLPYTPKLTVCSRLYFDLKKTSTLGIIPIHGRTHPTFLLMFKCNRMSLSCKDV